MTKARELLTVLEGWAYERTPSIHAFIAGVLVSVAVNILTGLATGAKTSWPVVISACLFFLSSLAFIGLNFRLERILQRTSDPGVDDLQHKRQEMMEERGLLRIMSAIALISLLAAIGFLVYGIVRNWK